MESKLKSDTKQIQVICDYLIKECEHDEHLAERVMLENKTLDNMYKYILKAVKKKYEKQIVNQGVYVGEDDVYSMAIHYFIEDDKTLEDEFPKPIKNEHYKPVEKSNAQVLHEKVVAKAKKEKDKENQLSFDLGLN